jgi:hypothetical protein
LEAIWREGQTDANGSVNSGNAITIGCENILLTSYKEWLEEGLVIA